MFMATSDIYILILLIVFSIFIFAGALMPCLENATPSEKFNGVQ